MIRAARILGTAILLASLARLSQEIGHQWGNQEVNGYSVALGVVSLLFCVRAAASEYAGRNISVPQRDFLWGISLGAFVAMLARLLQ